MTSEPQQTARLIFHADSMRRVLSIDSLPFRVGRSEHCNLVIPHPQVSREHASIEWNGSNYVLRDQSSRHGTFVNGVRVTSVILHAGDSIALGSRHTVLVFEDSDGDGSQTLLAQFSKRWSTRRGTVTLRSYRSFCRLRKASARWKRARKCCARRWNTASG